jgi:hypothetical protein
VVTDRGADGLPSGLRRERRRKQQPLDVELDLAEGLCGGGDPLAQIGLDRAGSSSGMMRRSNRKLTRSGTTLVAKPPWIVPMLSDGDLIPVIREVLRASDGRCR